MRGVEIASLAIARVSAISTISLTIIRCRKEYNGTSAEIRSIKDRAEQEMAQLESESDDPDFIRKSGELIKKMRGV